MARYQNPDTGADDAGTTQGRGQRHRRPARVSGHAGLFMACAPSPKFADLAQALGAQTRFGSSLPAKHYEIAILDGGAAMARPARMVRPCTTGARKAGISQGIIDAIHRGEKPPTMDAQEEAIWQFAKELQQTRERVSDATLAKAKELFGPERRRRSGRARWATTAWCR